MSTGYEVIDNYIAEVRSQEYPACREQLALCDHVEQAFAEEQIYLDEKQLQQYFNYERYFPFKLLPWERFVFALHNCVYVRGTGLLRWPVLFCLLGRGAGKNGYASFEAFCLMTKVNGVRNYDIDIFAMAEEQAKTSFNDVHEVLETHSAVMKKYFKWTLEKISNRATQSTLQFRTANHKTKDGGRPGAVIFDELHGYEDYKLLDIATTGLGKKAFPRRTYLTTDGDVRGGPLDDFKAQAEDVLFHGMKDLGNLFFICKLDDAKEVSDRRNWHKANPSLKYFPTLQQELETEYATYLRNPSGNSSFMVRRMNIPKTFDAESVTSWDNITACNREFPDLQGAECIAGIDYAKTTDFVCAGLLFKFKDTFYFKQHTWVCKASVDLPKIKAPLDDWQEKGYLDFVDAVEIDPDIVSEWLVEQGQTYNITALAMDNFRITLLKKSLKDHGFDTDKNGANNIRLMKRVTQNRYIPLITSLFNTNRIVWDSAELMNWYTWNTAVETERNGNQYYTKKDAERRKTDGFMCLVAALCASDDLQDAGAFDAVEEGFTVFNF